MQHRLVLRPAFLTSHKFHPTVVVSRCIRRWWLELPPWRVAAGSGSEPLTWRASLSPPSPSPARHPFPGPPGHSQPQTGFCYYLRGVPLKRAPGDQHRIAPNAHPTAPWPMVLGWGVSGDNLCATFMPRLCVYGRLMAPPHTGGCHWDRALEVAYQPPAAQCGHN